MKKAIYNRLLYCFFALLFIAISLIVFRSPSPSALKGKPLQEGAPICITKNRLYLSPLTDFCVDDQYIYVLLGDKGIIKVYSLDGDYVRTFAVRTHKGSSSLRKEKDSERIFYIDENLNYYVFTDGEWVDYLPYQHDYAKYVDDLEHRFVEKEEQRRSDQYVYYRKLASIIREDKDGIQFVVVHRPFYMVYFQGLIPFITIMSLIFICFFLNILRNKAKTQ